MREQTLLKLAKARSIPERLVSLHEIEARPIKKGKKFPPCEFGSTLQLVFNRQGFLITTENFIGQPQDKTLYRETLKLYYQRMKRYPHRVITDQGYRSRLNRTQTPKSVKSVLMGRSEDVAEKEREGCISARSATEGFIAVAKNLRGFRKSLYPHLKGHRIWTLLCQITCNLKKFLQLYRKEEISEKSLIALGLLST